jgi:hypothetical protein
MAAANACAAFLACGLYNPAGDANYSESTTATSNAGAIITTCGLYISTYNLDNTACLVFVTANTCTSFSSYCN